MLWRELSRLQISSTQFQTGEPKKHTVIFKSTYSSNQHYLQDVHSPYEQVDNCEDAMKHETDTELQAPNDAVGVLKLLRNVEALVVDRQSRDQHLKTMKRVIAEQGKLCTRTIV